MLYKSISYRSIFLKAKTQIEKKLVQIQDFDKKKEYLEFELKNEILKSENEIQQSFDKVQCANCGACCSLAVSEFSPDELLRRTKNGDKTAKSFLEVFEPYKALDEVPKNLLPEALKESCSNKKAIGNLEAKESQKALHGKTKENETFFYHCKKVQKKDGKSFCPIYDSRPAVCRNFPDTPLEHLPKT